MPPKQKQKPLTKTQFVQEVAEGAGLSKKEVSSVLDAMTNVIGQELNPRKGPQAVTIPGLCKIIVQHKPATKAKKGIPNPFRPGELMDVAAKPARNIIKVRPLKGLKDMA